MQSASTEIVKLHSFFICRYIPADRFAALQIFDNLLHIIYRNRLIRKFTINIKILFNSFDARMINKLN